MWTVSIFGKNSDPRCWCHTQDGPYKHKSRPLWKPVDWTDDSGGNKLNGGSSGKQIKNYFKNRYIEY